MAEEKAKPTAEERALYRRVAKAMWTVQKGKDLPEDTAEVSELWAADKSAMMAQARKVTHRLRRLGITLVLEKDSPGK